MNAKDQSACSGNAFGSMYVYYANGRPDNLRLDCFPDATDLIGLVGQGYEARPVVFHNSYCLLVFSKLNREVKECNERATSLWQSQPRSLQAQQLDDIDCICGTAVVIKQTTCACANAGGCKNGCAVQAPHKAFKPSDVQQS